jgi:hypothetical protein
MSSQKVNFGVNRATLISLSSGSGGDAISSKLCGRLISRLVSVVSKWPAQPKRRRRRGNNECTYGAAAAAAAAVEPDRPRAAQVQTSLILRVTWGAIHQFMPEVMRKIMPAALLSLSCTVAWHDFDAITFVIHQINMLA